MYYLAKVIQNSPKVYLNVDLNISHLRDYHHFTQNPEILLGLLDLLTKHVGKKQINEWRKMVNEKDFPLWSLLKEHYDRYMNLARRL